MDLAINDVELQFDQSMQFWLNVCLGIVMFGVALNLKKQSFASALSSPKSVLVGLSSQYLLLPLLTIAIVLITKMPLYVGLGFIIVAACPGGNVSNFFTLRAKGNIALSVLLSLLSTLGAVLLTPMLIGLMAHICFTENIQLEDLQIPLPGIAKTITIIMLIPIIAGLMVQHFKPLLAMTLNRILQPVSFGILLLFIGGALMANWEVFVEHIFKVLPLVMLHNVLAFVIGYGWAILWKQSRSNAKAVSIETGIQNTGLGLVLIFGFFNANGAMAVIAACWGIWHLVAGTILSSIWRRMPAKKQNKTHVV